jgi:hypothetical protein
MPVQCVLHVADVVGVVVPQVPVLSQASLIGLSAFVITAVTRHLV